MKKVIYSNYDVYEQYYDVAKEWLIELGVENPTEEQIVEEMYSYDEMNWSDVASDLKSFFDDSDDVYIAKGSIGRWNGVLKGGYIVESYMDLFKIAKDCEYIEIYEENNHFYVKASHHDGSNFIEVKKLNNKGLKYFKNNDEISIEKLFNKNYSVLPRFMEKVYGI